MIFELNKPKALHIRKVFVNLRLKQGIILMNNFKYPETPHASEPTLEYGRVCTADTPMYRPLPYEMEVLRRSQEDIKAGHLYTQEEADKMIEGWLN